MFDRVCWSSCLSATATVFDDDTWTGQRLCESIRTEFKRLFSRLELGSDVNTIRYDVVGLHATLWASLKTMTVCLWCLQGRPEHAMTCGHASCGSCVAAFASPTSRPYIFYVHKCPLCLRRAGCWFRNKPPTAAPCLLSLDGGGIKIVVAIRLMIKLQSGLGPHERLQDYFDIVVGTSAGKMKSKIFVH
jgi:hypothetical protein